MGALAFASRRPLVPVLAVTLLARLPSLWEPRWAPDEGTLSAVGQGILHGQRLYAEIWDNQAPLVYAWMAGVLAVTHGWHPGMQAILAGQVLLATAMVYVLAERIGARAAPAAVLFGLVLALPVVEGNLQNSEIIGLPFLLAGFVLGTSGGMVSALLAGVLLAAAALSQPGFALQSLAVAWYLARSGKPLRLLPVVAGGVVAGVFAVIALVVAGSWTAYVATSSDDRAYLVWANGGADLAGLSLLLRLGPLALALLAGVQLSIERDTAATRLLGPWLPFSVATAVLTPRGFMHYSLLVAAPICLVFGVWIGWRTLAPALAATVLALQVLLFLPRLEMFMLGAWPSPSFAYGPFGWAQLPTYYGNWAGVTSGSMSRLHYERAFPNEPDRVEALARAMQVEGRLAVWGDRPWLYVISDRRPAERYVVHNTAYRLQPRAAATSVAAIRRARPEYVVLVDRAPPPLRAVLDREYDRLRSFPPPWPTYGLRHG